MISKLIETLLCGIVDFEGNKLQMVMMRSHKLIVKGENDPHR